LDLAELSAWIPRIERSLRDSYREERRAWGPTFRPYASVLEEFALRGGKRFRAQMVLAGFHLVAGRPPTPALPAAAAMEHFQSWMLIHDDIIDHSEQRRGGPTVHRALEERHRASGLLGDPASYGLGLGITLGDLEEPFTVGGLLASPVPAPRILAAVAEYRRMCRWTALGQLLDIANGARPIAEVRERDVMLVHRLKSAIYTVAAPLRIGATLAGGRARLLEELERFGLEVGTAFQLRDDVLGAGFDAGRAGKSANDLVEGKRTLLLVRAFEKGTPADRAALERVVGRTGAGDEEVAGAREVLRRTGSLDYSEATIERIGRRAFARVRTSRSIPASGRSLLLEIGERLIHRSR
jgi:geranylgeranyl diphosphate synthase, type I